MQLLSWRVRLSRDDTHHLLKMQVVVIPSSCRMPCRSLRICNCLFRGNLRRS